MVGFISGYLRPDEPNNLFIWQVAVAETARGQGLAKQLLSQLIQRPNLADVTQVTTTISPSNTASQKVFQKMAAEFDCKITVTPFLESDLFGSENHEAEELYSLSSKSPLALSIKTTKGI